MRRSLAVLALLTGTAALLAACATPAGPAASSPTPSTPVTPTSPPTSPTPDGALEADDVVGVRWEPAPEWLTAAAADTGMGNPQTPFVQLQEDGTLEGSDGCNGTRGTWELTEGRLAIELGPSTRMACAGPAVPTLLASAREVARDGDALVLTLDDGSEGRLVPSAD